MQRALALVLAAAMMVLSQTLYLAGDSTMAIGGGGPTVPGTKGWGEYLHPLLTIPVINHATAGRSARSYTREGRFAAIAANLTRGDWVVMEFGHNDGGLTFTDPDNGRQDCPPAAGAAGYYYASTCPTVYNGTTETVLTYHAYEVNATTLFHSRGAHVLISTMTPSNPWETGTFSWSENYYYTYARDAAATASADFVDHGLCVASTYAHMTASAVDALFPIDHTHTSPVGAGIVARAFVEALQQSGSELGRYIRVE